MSQGNQYNELIDQLFNKTKDEKTKNIEGLHISTDKDKDFGNQLISITSSPSEENQHLIIKTNGNSYNDRNNFLYDEKLLNNSLCIRDPNITLKCTELNEVGKYTKNPIQQKKNLFIETFNNERNKVIPKPQNTRQYKKEEGYLSLSTQKDKKKQRKKGNSTNNNHNQNSQKTNHRHLTTNNSMVKKITTLNPYINLSPQNIKESAKNIRTKKKLSNLTVSNNIKVEKYSFEKRFEKYNMDKLAYDAYKSVNHCRTTESNFLDRMKFYAVKKQTQNDIVKQLIQKYKPRISEKDKLTTFNRLINDSKRRAEAKNRLKLIQTDKLLQRDFYGSEKDLLVHTKRKKFNKKRFDTIYYETITKKLQEKNKRIEYYEEEKKKKEQEQEDAIVEEMKKYSRKASKEKILLISQRLYNEHPKKNKSESLTKKPRGIKKSKTENNYNYMKSSRSISKKSFNTIKNCHNREKESKYNFNDSKFSISRKDSFTSSKTQIKQRVQKRKIINNKDRYLHKTLSYEKNNIQYIKKPNNFDVQKGKFIPYYHIDKLIETFFKNNK